MVYKPGYPFIGQGLTAPSTQTVIPVMTHDSKVIAFASVSKTTFTGSETTFTLASGAVPLQSVQLAPKVQENVIDNQRVEEFMAIMWPADVEWQKPWLGYPELVFADDPHNIDFWGFWSLPVNTIMYRFSNGYYLTALHFNLAPPGAPTSEPQPVPPTPQDGSIRWVVTMDKAALTTNCAFLDFNWVDLFKTNSNVINQFGIVNPVNITVVSNPATGEFKASVLQGLGQTVIGQGQALFDTVRILRLRQPDAGAYTFQFNIQAGNETNPQVFPATLTLNVV